MLQKNLIKIDNLTIILDRTLLVGDMEANYLLFIGQIIFTISSAISSWRIYKRKSSVDFSIAAIIMGYIGLCCMFAYSLSLMLSSGVQALFLQNLINLLVNTINTGLVIYYYPSRYL